MNFLVFVLVIFLLVMIHEFGHFITAKLSGMRVDEFAFGFPPRLISKKINGTNYSINALPLGGYVSIFGENGDGAITKGSFKSVVWWKQIIVLLAGCFMNFLLAVVIFTVSSFGVSKVSSDDKNFVFASDKKVTIAYVAPLMSAYEAGIRSGDELVGVNTKKDKLVFQDEKQVLSFLSENIQEEVTLVVKKKDGEIFSASVKSKLSEGAKTAKFGLGLVYEGSYDRSIFEAIRVGFEKTYEVSIGILNGLVDIFSIFGKDSSIASSMSGPLGIASIVMDASEESSSSLWFIIAVLSINLGVFNLLPIPALDGGRAIMVVGERLLRKKVPDSVLLWVNGVSFALLGLLLVFVTYNDLLRLLK